MSALSIADTLKARFDAMDARLDGTIKRSVTIPGYSNPMAYDPDYNARIGYWICKGCKSSFWSVTRIVHFQDCPIADKANSIYQESELVYVLGPKENGFFYPFKEGDLDKVKAATQSKLSPLRSKL